MNLTAAQQSLTQNYNQASTGFNFSVSYPLKRHAFQRVGFTYSLSRSSITAFSTASQTFFQTISFRSGIQGSNALAGIVNSHGLVHLLLQHHQQPACVRAAARNTRRCSRPPASGATCATSAPLVAYKQFMPMHYLMPVGQRPQRAGRARAVGLCAGLRRRRGSAQQPLLLRRRERVARLRRSRRYAVRLRSQLASMCS